MPTPEPLSSESPPELPSRKNFQLGRRLVHMANGGAIAGAYAVLFSRPTVVSLFGTIACLVYILDRVRFHYPEVMERAPWFRDLFFRAEEQFRESAMVPYVIAILLTILTFPKPVALIAILTLAVADPLSALVGIRFGRRRIVPEKSVEGSLAFFAAVAACAALVLAGSSTVGWERIAGASVLIAALAALFEMLPIRLDDNLTIPLFVGFVGWIVCGALGVPV